MNNGLLGLPPGGRTRILDPRLLTSFGPANVFNFNCPVPIDGLEVGHAYSFIAHQANTTAAVANLDGSGQYAIQVGGLALAGAEITLGVPVVLIWGGIAFELANPRAQGGLIGIRTFSAAGATVYTPTAGALTYLGEVIGAGGGGGGAALTGAGQCAIGASASGGGYAFKRGLISTISGATVTVGAKGTGGTAGANNGSAGGTSSIGAVMSATGSAGGVGGPAATSPFTVSPGAVGAGSGGDMNMSGRPAGFGITVASVAGQSGSGGFSQYGNGAGNVGSGTGAAGNSANNAGGGGSGAVNAASQGTGKAGGDGADGLVRIWEYA